MHKGKHEKSYISDFIFLFAMRHLGMRQKNGGHPLRHNH